MSFAKVTCDVSFAAAGPDARTRGATKTAAATAAITTEDVSIR
jgi:hypothetical protein